MINGASKVGIMEILSSLDNNTVLSLATTITQGLLKNRIFSRQDAVTAVLNYSPDALSFLRRKMITREVLLAYLHNKNISINLPTTKTDLIQRIAHFWEIQYIHEVATNTETNALDSGTVSQLAEQFSRWFYTMLNKTEDMDPKHFYPDAKLQINMINNGQCTSDVVEGDPQKIVQRLLLLRSNFNLFFNQNLSGGGVLGRVDPHGLVMVIVCGSLHVEGVCMGVFEQVFGLVRDPQMQNNWRIKTTEMNLKSQSGVTELPTLDSANFLSLTQQ